MQILQIDSSVAGAKSASRPLTKAAADQLLSVHPDAKLVYRDLIQDPLRHYTAVLRVHGAESDTHTPEQKAELAVGETILQEFLAADVVVVGVPMYNFSVPSQLKAWIDLICVAGKTFRYSPTGPVGLCGEKRAIVISTSGGLYGPGSPFEPYNHQSRYIKDVFSFLGITNVTIITAEGLAIGPEKAASAIEDARSQISQLT